MASNEKLFAYELIYVVVNYGMGSRVLQKAKECGIRGGTITLGKGTISNPFMNFLSLYEEEKEIVLLGTDKKTAEEALEKLNRVFRFEKPHHGIMFTVGMCNILGTSGLVCEPCEEGRGVDRIMYQLILSIVNRGKAEDVIEAAKEAGSKGGTIINARGSGIHETSKLFHMDIEPEKEIVMILSKKEHTQGIVQSVQQRLELNKPGNGIIFVQDVSNAYGIYE